jgi:hypothetical protein
VKESDQKLPFWGAAFSLNISREERKKKLSAPRVPKAPRAARRQFFSAPCVPKAPRAAQKNKIARIAFF